jgi:hypothetical protein
MVKCSAFQAENVGSIPTTHFILGKHNSIGKSVRSWL